MTVRSRTLLAAAVGLGLAGGLPAQEPAKLGVEKAATASSSRNQQMATSIAQQLRQNARLSGYKIDIVFLNGVAEVGGCVNDLSQKEEALRIVQGVPGVERVRDRLMVMMAMNPVMQAQAAMPENVPPPRRQPDMGMGGPPMMGPGMPGLQGLPPGAIPGPGMGGLPPGAIPGPGMGGFPGPQEPTPIYAAGGGGGGPYSLPAANMPPYAWPTYAPYNNYSRVAAPSAYPEQAWPFIGPPYPFPKVPLGWRSVKLEWVDGHWWFGNTAQCHDWWRLRYW